MKNVFMMRKKKDAVSPVIATILMVAITVVLAAVLYVMVMGFGGGSNNTPSASMTYTKAAGSAATLSNYTFTCASISSTSVPIADLQVICNPAPGSGTATWTSGSSPAGTYAAAGDHFTLTDLTKGTTYTITVKYATTGGAVYSLNLVAA
ncbi:MAG: hypothetical protein A4E32_00589 [Methanomassiliicoccales archaeon PtaU1.Bin124]|nr:MAG: hypothetical protein A4E32_00589 [Methanomassiliicoccales archaeon PtaU1.Bin124]